MADINQLKQFIASDNLAEGMTEEELKTVSSDLLQGYETDKESRAEWEEKYEDITSLAMQVMETKFTPWSGASNIKFPLLSISSMQFNARMYPAIVRGLDVVKGIPIGRDAQGDKAKTANRIGKHMSYQLLHEMEDWEDDMDKGLFVLPMVGTFFKKTYYDSTEGKNVSELVLPTDVVVNFYAKNLKTAPRVTHILRESSNDIYINTMDGLYRDIGLFDAVPDTDESQNNKKSNPRTPPSEGTMAVQDAQSQGVEQPSVIDSATPHELLEIHCYRDLDGDGYEEPYIVTIHKDTREVLRIVARFDESGIVKTRKTIKINPIDFWTNYIFLPDLLSGIYGIGFGQMEGPINESINTLVNQLIDAGTLSNLQSGFIAPGVKIKGGVARFKPGEWKMAQIVGDNIQNKILPLPVREPSNVLLLLLNVLIGHAEKLASTVDVLTGELPGQNTKATVVLQAVEQGSKVFNAVAKRVFRSFTKEVKKLYLLNSKFLPEEDYFNVLDTSQSEPQPIARVDYDPESVDVMPSADPTVSSQAQQIAKIEAMAPGVEMGEVNRREWVRRLAEATEQPDIKTLMEVPQPGPDPALLLEQAKLQGEMRLRLMEIAIKDRDSQAKALKFSAEYLKTLSEIQDMIQKGELAQAQAAIDISQKQFDNVLALVDRSEASEQQPQEGTPVAAQQSGGAEE